jgi:hypothetical protein
MVRPHTTLTNRDTIATQHNCKAEVRAMIDAQAGNLSLRPLQITFDANVFGAEGRCIIPKKLCIGFFFTKQEDRFQYGPQYFSICVQETGRDGGTVLCLMAAFNP